MVEANQPQESRSSDLKSELNQVTGEFKRSHDNLIDRYDELDGLDNKLEALIAELATIKKQIGAKQEEIRTSLRTNHSLENEIIDLRHQIRQVKDAEKMQQMPRF